MKNIALVCLGALLVAGCASSGKFAGHSPSVHGASGTSLWEQQEAKSIGGIKNKAIVRAVRGDAFYSTNQGQTWPEARVGTPLTEGSLAKAGPNSSADLFLGENGPVLRLTENSTIQIVRLELVNTGIEKVINTMIDLQKGRILGSVKKMAAASSYLVRTPVGVVQIRGTEYDISADGTVRIVEGSVVVHAKGKSTVVHKGQDYSPFPKKQNVK